MILIVSTNPALAQVNVRDTIILIPTLGEASVVLCVEIADVIVLDACNGQTPNEILAFIQTHRPTQPNTCWIAIAPVALADQLQRSGFSHICPTNEVEATLQRLHKPAP